MFDYNFIYTDTDTLQKTQQNFIKNTKEKKTKHKLPLNRKKKWSLWAILLDLFK